MADEPEYTEAELTGEETTPETPPAAEPAKEPAVIPPGEPAKPPAETPKVETPPAEPVKQVPLAALHEAREANRALKSQIEDLGRQIAALQPQAKDPTSLITEDPEAAMAEALRRIDELRAEIDRRDMEREIKTAVPDFFEKAAQMEEYLYGMGFYEAEVKGLIGASGKKVPTFFKILADNVSRPDEKTLRESITAELTPQITASVTAQVTKDLMAKFNITETPTNLNKLPGSGPLGKIVADTEEDFAKLSPKEQEAFLSGEA